MKKLLALVATIAFSTTVLAVEVVQPGTPADSNVDNSSESAIAEPTPHGKAEAQKYFKKSKSAKKSAKKASHAKKHTAAKKHKKKHKTNS